MSSPLCSHMPGSQTCGHTVRLVPLHSATMQPVHVWEGAGTCSVPWFLLLRLWVTEVSTLSLFFLSVRVSSQCSMKSLLPVPFVPVHLWPCGSFPHISRVPQRFSQLQGSVLLTFHLLSLTSVVKYYYLSSLDDVYFLGKHFTFSVTELNIPFNCISCSILSHPITFQHVIAAVTSPNAVMVKHLQFSEAAFASFFQWSKCAFFTGHSLPKCLLSLIPVLPQEDKPYPCFFMLPCSLQTTSSFCWL